MVWLLDRIIPPPPESADEMIINRSALNGTLGLFFFQLLIFVVVLVVVIYMIRYFSHGTQRHMRGKNIQIVESASVGYGNILHLIQVGKEILLIASNKDRLQYLTKLEPDSIDLELFNQTAQLPTMQFKGYIEKFMSKMRKESDDDQKNGRV